jgi:HD-like signal output (HDOD) protein
MEWIRSRLERIEDLPTLPLIVDRFSRAARGNNWEVSEVAGIIRRDPAISTNILRACNSSLYRTRATEPVDTIDSALVHLGITVVRHIVFSTSIIKAFKSIHSEAFPIREFWVHSLCTGMVANLIPAHMKAEDRAQIDPDRLNLAGLIHDLGKIILLKYFPDEFGNAIHHARENDLPLHKAELVVLGANHAEIGGWLANRWVKSTLLHHTVRWHHSPLEADPEATRMAAVVHLADYLCNRETIGFSGNKVLPVFHPEALEHLGLTPDTLESIARDIRERDISKTASLYFSA